MNTKQEAARRIAEREANHKKSVRAAAWAREQARRTLAAGRKIVIGRNVEIMAFDASNPPQQPAAEDLLKQVAKLLGVEPNDEKALETAFNSLLEAAGLEPNTPSPDGEDPGGANTDQDGSEGDGAEGVAPPPVRKKRAKAIDPEVIDRKALARGRRMLAGTERRSNAIDPAAVARGRRAFK